MKIEIHYLQSFPVGNPNRDDTGAPKDAIFGGSKRARISSQCFKRAIRKDEHFTDRLNGNIAFRTRQSANKGLAVRLLDDLSQDMASALAEGFISQLVTTVEKNGQTNVLFYVGETELDEMAQHIKNAGDLTSQAEAYLQAKADLNTAEVIKDKTQIKKCTDAFKSTQKELMKGFENEVKTFIKNNKGTTHSVEIALFGRMLAEQPDLNVDACCQVAHALSTHKISMEFDYFTAVDDLETGTGAGHIGQLGFNAPCFYRYAVIDADALASRLKGDTALAKEGILAFLEASFWAIPSGKQNSSANHVQPSLAFAVVRDKSAPQNLVNAFSQPVRATEDVGMEDGSARKLVTEWNDLQAYCGTDDVHGFLAAKPSLGTLDFDKTTNTQNLKGLLKAIEAKLNAHWNLKSEENHA
jgi:CRISPR system Cascade subunit CasC